MLTKILNMIRRGEEGHAEMLPGIVGAAAGAVMLGVGATADNAWLACGGGTLLAVGIVAMMLLNHMIVEWGILARLDALEKK
jgi:hypothetical protein